MNIYIYACIHIHADVICIWQCVCVRARAGFNTCASKREYTCVTLQSNPLQTRTSNPTHPPTLCFNASNQQLPQVDSARLLLVFGMVPSARHACCRFLLVFELCVLLGFVLALADIFVSGSLFCKCLTSLFYLQALARETDTQTDRQADRRIDR